MEVSLINTSSWQIRFAAILGLLAILVGMAPAAHAQGQAGGLVMQAAASFDGFYKYGEWLPLRVQLENNGADLNGEVQVRVPGRSGTSVYASPVALPTGSRKLVTLYALPNNFSHSLDVQFVADNKVVVSQKVTVRPQPNINYMIGLLAPDRGPLSMIVGAKLPGMVRTKVLVDLTLQDIPERPEGLRSFDTIILNGLDTSSLTTRQKTALETWVSQGGRLVIGGGASAMQVTSGLPESLLPFTPRNLTELNVVDGLAEYAKAEPVRVPGPFVIATTDVTGGVVLSEQDGHPLLVEKTVGMGFVDLVALDLIQSPFDAWVGTTPFWERLLAPNAAYPDTLPPDMSPRQMASNQIVYALTNLPAMDLPSIRSLTVLLAFYIILVGPVNYWLLRWQKRLHWAWVTIPLVTVVFSAGAFTLGYLMRGNDLILNRIVVAEFQPGGTANVRSFYGLFSPSQSSYEIEVSGNGLLSQISPDYDPWSGRPMAAGSEMFMVQGEPNRLRGLTVNQWSMQSFMTEGVWTGQGSIASNLRLDNGRLTGTLRNETDYTIEDPVLLVGNQIIHLQPIAAGAEVVVDASLNDLLGPMFGASLGWRIFEQEFNKPMPNGPSRQLQLKQSVIESLFPYGSVVSSKFGGGQSLPASSAVLLGWFSPEINDVRVGGRLPAQQTTALMFTSLPYSLPESGRVVMPAGLIKGTMTEMPFEGGTCGPYGTASVYLGRGSAVFEFTLDEQYHDLDIDTLNVYIGTEGGWSQVPETSIYNWEAEDWVLLEKLNTGSNFLREIDGLVSENGIVRIKFSTTNGFGGGCYFPGLGFEGNQQ